jgi:hypothetical protein
MPVTLFSWGYYGWGSHTKELVEAVDAVEKERGFKPPIFVDIRIRRTVRAAGFSGSAFEKLLGEDRHRWMKALGNKRIETGTGPRIQIAEPEAAEELLDRAVEAARTKRRLLFFCSCLSPKIDGGVHCHRAEVGRLLLKAAKRRGIKAEVVEWPGGKPSTIDVQVPPKVFTAVFNGRMLIPLGEDNDVVEVAGLPWCSIANVRSGSRSIYRLVGPAIARTHGWALPIMFWFHHPATGLRECKGQAAVLRESCGLDSSRV